MTWTNLNKSDSLRYCSNTFNRNDVHFQIIIFNPNPQFSINSIPSNFFTYTNQLYILFHNFQLPIFRYFSFLHSIYMYFPYKYFLLLPLPLLSLKHVRAISIYSPIFGLKSNYRSHSLKKNILIY